MGSPKDSGRAPRPPISLADVFLASSALQPRDAKTRAMMLGLLGFEAAPEVAAAAPVGPWKAVAGTTSAGAPPTEPAPPARRLPIASEAPRLLGAPASSTLIQKTKLAPPAWAAQIPAAPFRPADGGAASLAPPPLFGHPRVRALLSAALGTLTEGREVDVDRAARTLANGRRLDRIPYRPVLTLRRGAQVLVDGSAAMDPYRHDVAQVLDDLQRLFGTAHLQRFDFSRCPSRGVRSAESRRRRPWRSPGRGVPVFVLSDLALGGSLDDDDVATTDEWLGFARIVRAGGSPVTALVPFPPVRWPASLARAMTLVLWSERTTVRQVVKALREARRVMARA